MSSAYKCFISTPLLRYELNAPLNALNFDYTVVLYLHLSGSLSTLGPLGWLVGALPRAKASSPTSVTMVVTGMVT